jgi:hypothetical protein
MKLALRLALWLPSFQEADHRCLLRFEAETRSALLLRRDAVVGKIGGHDRTAGRLIEVLGKDRRYSQLLNVRLSFVTKPKNGVFLPR